MRLPCQRCPDAARHGHLKCLQRLHRVHWWPDIRICSTAAAFGHLDCLEWAHKQGCGVWAEQICQSAAKGLHLSCLRYALDQGWWEAQYMNDVPDGVAFWCARHGFSMHPSDMERAATVGRALANAALCLSTTPLPRVLMKNIVETALLCK